MPILAVAPMLDWTDRHYRYFMRQITQATTLYTEMIVADAILQGKLERLLSYDPIELPLVVQLGGNNPNKLSKASYKCFTYGYTAINLNVGCPSSKVKSGNFGACLMADAPLVAQCIKAMQDSISIPVTIKHRIGLNYNYAYDYLRDFVGQIAETGCRHFIIHARNAVLTGLSPKQNREIPPLQYAYVYRLKQEFPHLEIVINGGIKTIEQIKHHLNFVDGVMLGREAYTNPYLLHNFDQEFFASKVTPYSRSQIALSMVNYLEKIHQQGMALHQVTRHMLGLYHGCPKAKLWRHTLSETLANDLASYIKLVGQMEEK